MNINVKGIEQNSTKNNIRTEIATQVTDWVRSNRISNLVGATLPASKWYFENILNTMLDNSNISHLNDVLFYGVEYDRHVALEAIRNRPDNAILINNSYHYLMTRQLNTRKCGIGFIEEDIRDLNKPFNFGWADYCGIPNLDLIRHVGEYMGRMKQGIFYVTFALQTRKKDGINKHFKQIGISTKHPVDDINKMIIKTAIKNGGKDVQEIYRVLYRGGKKNSTNMVTLGYVIGKTPKNSVKIINKDIRVDETRKNNGQTYFRFKNNLHLFVGRKIIKTSKQYGSKTTIEQKEEIKKLAKRGLSNATIAKKVGVSLRSVGSTMAHVNHPDVFKKARNK